MGAPAAPDPMMFAPESLAPPTGLRAAIARAPLLLLAMATLAGAMQVLAHVAQSDDFVMKHLVLDDAVYFCKPARNFVDGRGFSFDGLHRTNGVQPLWAIVTTALAFVVRDDMALLRVTAGLSGLLWMAGGVLLFFFLQPWGRFAACIAAIGWMLAGVEMRLGISGMENGMQGFLIAASLLLGARLAATPPAAPTWRSRALQLGFCAAAMCLNRVEFGLLAIGWGVWLLAVQLRAQPARAAVTAVACYALPVLAIGLAWALTSKLYFGDWTPISGAVKAWNTSTQPNPHGGIVGSCLHHLVQAIALSVLPLVFSTGDLAYRLFGVALGVTGFAWIFATAFGLLLVPMLASQRKLRPRRDGATGPLLWLLAFSLLHVVLMSIYLASFTIYCTWYFTPQIVTVWLFGGLLLASADRGWRRLFALPLTVLVLAGAVHRGAVHFPQPPRHVISSTGELVDLAHWIDRWLPDGARVGVFNAGFCGLLAKSHTVVNLDGLMNDGRYLREYLSQNRVDDYMREEGIRYLADNWPVQQWRDCANRIGLRLPPDMRPLHCYRTHTNSLACVLAVRGADTDAVPAHPLAALLWRTFTAASPALVADAEVAAIPADQQIAATVLEPPLMTVRHVVVPRAEARSAVDAAGLDRLTAVSATFADRVQLLAVELPPGLVDPGATVAITTYWRPLPGLESGGDLRLCLRLGEQGAPAALRCDAPAHGTLPLQQWPQDQILAHTFCVAVPADREGPCDVWVAVQPGDGAGVRVGALRLERY